MPESFIPKKESEILSLLDDIDSEGQRAKDGWPDIKRWKKYVQLSRGEKIYGDRESPIFRADIASPAVNRKTALLTESKPILEINPRRPGLDNTATIIKETFQAIWSQQSVQMMLETLRGFMGVMGCGGTRVIWDKRAAYGLGEIQLPSLDPRLVRFDPSIVQSYDMDKAQYIGPMESIRPLSELQRAYPDRADKMRASGMVALIGDGTTRKGGSGLRGAIQTPVGLSRDKSGGQANGGGAVPRVYTREYWIVDPATEKDGSPKYPGGRYFVRVGDKGQDMLANFSTDDEDDQTANPYFDGLWDVEWLDNIPDLDHPYGRSEIGAIRYLQEAFNRIANLIAKAGLRNGYPIVFATNNALTPDKIAELKDLEMFVIEYQQGRDIKREQPTIAIEQQMAMLQLILQLVDMVLGTGDGGRAPTQGRQEVRSGDQLEGLQQAGQVLVRAEARRLESFLERVGKKMISRFFQYMTDDRLMTYYGGGDTFTKFQFERQKLVAEVQALGVKTALMKAQKRGEDSPELQDLTDEILIAIKGAWRDFDMDIVPGSSLASTKTQRAMLKFQLAQAMMIPKSDVVAEVGISNPREKVQEAAAEAAANQALGIPPPQAKGTGGKKK